MRTRLITRSLVGLTLFGIGGICFFGGCSIETKASDVICVKDQTDICTNCVRPEGDDRAYRGRHTCAADGKSFGACMQCAPITDDGDKPHDPSDFKPIPNDDGDGGSSSTAAFPDACNKKLTVVAGKDDVADQFVYAAVVENGRFSVYASSGAPMRSQGAFIISEGTLTGVYRSKGSALVSSTFKNGLWNPPVAIDGALTDATPAIVTWGKEAKAVFHTSDNHYSAVDFDPDFGWGLTEIIGTTTTGTSPPAAATVGAPGVSGAGVMFGYTDNAGGLFRQDWNGDTWRPAGLKSSVVDAAAMKTSLISMNGGAFDLVSAFVARDTHLYISTRAVRDNSSVWSNPILVNGGAAPLDGVNAIGLPNGRALFVYRDAQKKGWFVVFDPSKAPQTFTEPAPLFGTAANPALASTPVVVEDRCGAEAILAYAEADGAVGVLRFAGDAWKAPVVVPKVVKMTYAMAAVLP